MAEQRRFRPPWKVVELDESFEVQDANDVALAYVYFADDKRRVYFNQPRLSKDEARRIAVGIARLPDLIALERKFRTGELMSPPDDPTSGE